MSSLFGMSESQRRSRLHMDVRVFEPNENFDSLVSFNVSAPLLEGHTEGHASVLSCGEHGYSYALGSDSVTVGTHGGNLKKKRVILGKTELNRNQLAEMLRRSKTLLGMRSPSQELIEQLERRRDWNIASRPIESNLDLFSGVKHSYSTALPNRRGMVDLLVSGDGQRARFSGIARSSNMRLDPLDAPRIAYKRRKEINRAIAWGYATGNIPVLMTLTVPHRWASLKQLIAVLRKSYDDLFGHKIGEKLKESIGFKYRIYRMEETLDNSFGWHPHYHVILFVPKENLNTLSDLELTLRERWSKSVVKYYSSFVGKELDEYEANAVLEHGLVLSRYSKDSREHRKGELRQVDSGDYLAKIMGCDDGLVYGGDHEMTATTQKDTMIPFDLLRGEITAQSADLWNEYAIATKGLSVFRFTRGFKDEIEEYFKEHPNRDPDKVKAQEEKKSEKIIGTILLPVYKLFADNFMLKDLQKKIVEGYDALCAWLKKMYVELGVPSWCDGPMFMPQSPD